MAILGGTSTVSDDGDRIHSDYSDEDEDDDDDEAQQQFPPRVRRLRRRHFHLLRMAAMKMKCAHWRHDHDEKVTAELERPQNHWQDSPRSGKRKRNDTGTERIVRSDSYNRNSNDESDLDEESATRKRRRLEYRSCHGSASVVDVIQGVEGLDGLPANANTDGAFEVPVPPSTITDPDLSEASALSVGPRRSQRIREKLGSAFVTTRGS